MDVYRNVYLHKKRRRNQHSSVFLLVRKMGLEPTRHGHTHLKRACLPIPALPHRRRRCVGIAKKMLAYPKGKVKLFLPGAPRGVPTMIFRAGNRIAHLPFRAAISLLLQVVSARIFWVRPIRLVLKWKKGRSFSWRISTGCIYSFKQARTGFSMSASV